MTIIAGNERVHFLGASMDADFTPGVSEPNSGVIDCIQADALYMYVAWTAGPLGTVIVEGCVDGTNWFPVTLTSEMVHDITADASLSASGDIELDGTGAGHVALNMEKPFGKMRCRWDWDSAGSSDTISCHYGKR